MSIELDTKLNEVQLFLEKDSDILDLWVFKSPSDSDFQYAFVISHSLSKISGLSQFGYIQTCKEYYENGRFIIEQEILVIL